MKSDSNTIRKMSVHSQRGQCAKRLSILEAAAEVFCRQGFAGASIDEIASAACVSRQTVYNHYREKDNLFMAVVEDVMERANAMLFSTLSSFPENPESHEDDLAAFAVRLSHNCICNQDGKFLRKLVLSEGERYPHLFESWHHHGPGKIGTALAALFARLSHRGLLQIDDFDVAARQFLALVNADLQMNTLFGVTPTATDLETAARNAVHTFLRAYASARPSPMAVRTA